MSKFSGLALEVERPARMVIVHPTLNRPIVDGSGNEAWIDLNSSDSEAAHKYQRATARRRLDVASRRGRAKVSPEQIEADAIDFLVAVTVGWSLVDLNGRVIDVECTPENARELYSDPGMNWLVEQVDQFVADRANFSPASSTNSSGLPKSSSGEIDEGRAGPANGTTQRAPAESERD